MIYTASEEDMRMYSQIIQQLSALEVQRNNLLRMLEEWENAHAVEEGSDEEEQS